MAPSLSRIWRLINGPLSGRVSAVLMCQVAWLFLGRIYKMSTIAQESFDLGQVLSDRSALRYRTRLKESLSS